MTQRYMHDHKGNDLNITIVKTKPSFAEFVVLISMMMSLTALSVDAMLPALPQIGQELGAQTANQPQLVISFVFFGLALGQLFFGPLSDSIGRKPAIYAGLAVFVAGSLVSLLAVNFSMILLGRLLQGVGASAPRAVTLALVRDQYEGRAMARVMSFVMTVFILVPMIAPTLGQAILRVASWRAIFGSFVLLAAIIFVWFALRQPETLAPNDQAPFTGRRIIRATQTVIKTRTSLGYTITAGLVMGAMLGYINSAQQIFQGLYGLGTLFPLYFAVVSSTIGVSSLLNSRLVMRYGMRFLVQRSLLIIFVLSAIAVTVTIFITRQPPFGFFMVYLMLAFFCIGNLFGNMNALAMQPLGQIAGIGAAVVGALSTLLSALLGMLIGQSYNGTVLPLVLGLAILSGLSMMVVRWAEAPQLNN